MTLPLRRLWRSRTQWPSGGSWSRAVAVGASKSSCNQTDPQLKLLSAAGLYGFFNPRPTAPQDFSTRYPVVVTALILTVTVSYVAMPCDAARRRHGLAILAAGLAEYFPGFGDRGATGGFFRLAYKHAPRVVTMREPSIAKLAAKHRRSDPPL